MGTCRTSPVETGFANVSRLDIDTAPNLYLIERHLH
jgi:hypothetical protein